MSDDATDELAPIDYLVVEFPAGKADFSGAMAEQLKALVEAGTIRVLDLLIITKDADGEVDAFEVHEFEDGEAGILRELSAEYAELPRTPGSRPEPGPSPAAPWVSAP